jgi:LAO/AO transport system kinase
MKTRAVRDPDVAAVLAGKTRAVARAISWVENRPEAAADLVRELFPHTGRALTLGITGSPGSGKSTLAEKLARAYLDQGGRVGVLAVDPTSPFSGGALLGDRVRMQSLSTEPRFFARSLATRGRLGGLSAAALDALTVLDAAGYDRILLETVGVGQDEVDIHRTCHLTLLVLVPGMGDEIQAIKAGIMEIADIFVVNKADREGTDLLVRQLHALAGGEMDKPPVVCCTVASRGEGIGALVQTIARLEAELGAEGLARRRLEADRFRILELLRRRVWQEALAALPATLLEEVLREVAARRLDPQAAVQSLLEKGRS